MSKIGQYMCKEGLRQKLPPAFKLLDFLRNLALSMRMLKINSVPSRYGSANHVDYMVSVTEGSTPSAPASSAAPVRASSAARSVISPHVGANLPSLVRSHPVEQFEPKKSPPTNLCLVFFIIFVGRITRGQEDNLCTMAGGVLFSPAA